MERTSHSNLNSISSPRLPLQMTTTIGREQEIRAVSSQLRMESTHLVTLTGPGGVGKTRLSLEIARTLHDTFPDAIFFVSLAPLHERAQILLAIASAFDVHEGGEETLAERLEAYLHERRCLLLLDNFEHLLEAADLVAELLAAAPQLKILATSREALHLYGEQEIEVLPLPCQARLLAQGHPDARIAQELMLSRRTVNTHLRSIYSKLGVTTRTAAARVAFEQQLA